MPPTIVSGYAISFDDIFILIIVNKIKYTKYLKMKSITFGGLHSNILPSGEL